MTNETHDEKKEISDEEFRFTSSLAPQIYGHLHLKKPLLLLVTAVHSNTFGMKIRGNINLEWYLRLCFDLG